MDVSGMHDQTPDHRTLRSTIDMVRGRTASTRRKQQNQGRVHYNIRIPVGWQTTVPPLMISLDWPQSTLHTTSDVLEPPKTTHWTPRIFWNIEEIKLQGNFHWSPFVRIRGLSSSSRHLRNELKPKLVNISSFLKPTKAITLQHYVTSETNKNKRSSIHCSNTTENTNESRGLWSRYKPTKDSSSQKC